MFETTYWADGIGPSSPTFAKYIKPNSTKQESFILFVLLYAATVSCANPTKFM
jgi:hypothetical protein